MSTSTPISLSSVLLLILPGIFAITVVKPIDRKQSVSQPSIPLNDTAECTKALVKEFDFDFVPTLKCQFLRNGIVTYALPLFADIDGDGSTEIVVTLEHSPNGFAIINPNNCAIEQLVEVNGDIQLKDGGTVIGDVDRNGFVDVFITVDTRIQRWEYDPATNRMVMIWETRDGVSTAERAHMDIWDMDQNGQAEIIPNIGFMVNGVTGYVYPGELPLLDTEGKGLFAFTADADPGEAPEGQGNVELIHGTHLYRYDFIQERWVLVREQPEIGWGPVANVSIADMDMDGDVDAVISQWDEVGQALIWDMQTNELLGNRIWDYPGTLGSRVNIANMDKDEYPEMVMTCLQKVFAVDDIVTTGDLGNIIWLDETSDESGHTQLTSFDFDGNGSYEIVYRDETQVRIFSGLGTGVPTNGYPSGPKVLLDSGDNSCESFTGMEYPTIGDIDNDNEAEIVASCIGGISIYESGSLPWGNASKVWNTQAFNLTCVNQDGTIPAIPIENYTIHNNFLAQVNLNPKSDTLFLAVPDATIDIIAFNDNCRKQLSLEMEICNQGAEGLPANVPVTLYWKDPTVEASTPFYQTTTNQSLDVGDCLLISTGYFSPPTDDVEIFAVVNDDGEQALPYILDDVKKGGSFPFNDIEECDYTNNMTLLERTLGENDVQTLDVEICEGESYLLGNEAYQKSGTYRYNTKNQQGCDSLIILNLAVLEHSEGAEYVAICEDEIFLFNDQLLNTSGVYKDTLVSLRNGCDSVVTLILDVFPKKVTPIDVLLCEGDVYELNGNFYDQEGTFSEVLPTQHGCDSTIQITIEIVSPPVSTVTREICEGETYQFGEKSFSESGVFQQVYSDVSGCDSIINLELIVHPIEFTKTSASFCEGEVFNFNGSVLSEPGVYLDTLTSVHGCDSIVELELRQFEKASLDLTVVICSESSYFYNGQRLREEGTYPFVFMGPNGCDSTVNLTLEKLAPNTTFITYEICEGDLLVVGDNLYSESGVYTGVLPATNGCDSIVNYALNVYNTYDTVTNMTICEGDSYFFEGTFYNQTGIYQKKYNTMTGCDSTRTLNLKVEPISYAFVDTTICEGDPLFISGELITEPGEYTQFDQNEIGCDSITFIDVKILPSTGLTAIGGPICMGDSIQLLAEGADSYEWFPAEGLSCTLCPDPLASPVKTTDYRVTTTGCKGRVLEATVRVEVFEIPEIEFGEDIEILFGETILLQPKVRYFFDGTIEWKINGIPVDCATPCPLELPLTPEETVTVTLTLTNELGCAAEDTIIITVRSDCPDNAVIVPNVISPNGDGNNDVFRVKFEPGTELKYMDLYNRWGEMVFHTSDPNQNWDGYYKGKLARNGDVYAVLIEGLCPNKKPFKYMGNLTVIR